jgi:hypothetical protein
MAAMTTLARTPALPSLPLAPQARPGTTALLERYGLAAIVAGFTLLAVWFSLVVPPFETPDELYHYAFVRQPAPGNKRVAKPPSTIGLPGG